MSFSEFGLQPALVRGVEDMGYTQATPIQNDAIPPAMQGRDLLACAMTGSGKTAAFLLPVLHRLGPSKRGKIRVLVITPTRELAAQVDEQRALLGKHSGHTGAAVFGGVGMAPQERAFRNGVDVMVATPGRLLDHLRQPYARLDGVEIVILDEADRMLDMGFLPDIRRVLSHLPKQRQTLLFSATMPAPIAELAREMLRNPVTLNIERQAAPATGITHAAYAVPQTLKSPLLLHLLQTGEMQSVVVFTRTKHRADRLAKYLLKEGINCERIHGNRSQAQRTDALQGFRNGKYRVLVATDIAARGIDVEDLSHVVNFDVPHLSEDYIHRVGRTARAEATGDAFTFVSPEEASDFKAIERAIGKQIPRLSAVGFDASAVSEETPETPIAERIAAIRARKAEERARAAAKAARKAATEAERTSAPARRPDRAPAGSRPGGSRPQAPRDARPREAVLPRGAAADGRAGDQRTRDARPRGNGQPAASPRVAPVAPPQQPGRVPSFRPLRGA
jgi:ATP-dependent RNA helicase RhlE